MEVHVERWRLHHWWPRRSFFEGNGWVSMGLGPKTPPGVSISQSCVPILCSTLQLAHSLSKSFSTSNSISLCDRVDRLRFEGVCWCNTSGHVPLKPWSNLPVQTTVKPDAALDRKLTLRSCKLNCMYRYLIVPIHTISLRAQEENKNKNILEVLSLLSSGALLLFQPRFTISIYITRILWCEVP